MSETKLTPKQKKWLDASKKIGRGAMTRSERETLEKLYTDMLPAEQVELKKYIEETFGEKSETGSSGETGVEPTELMSQVEWSDPSDALKQTLSKTQKPRWLKIESE